MINKYNEKPSYIRIQTNAALLIFLINSVININKQNYFWVKFSFNASIKSFSVTIKLLYLTKDLSENIKKYKNQRVNSTTFVNC